jgi:3-oxoacyl-ACP reductase-like protein
MMKKTLAQRNPTPEDRECVTLEKELEWLNWSPEVVGEEESGLERQAEAERDGAVMADAASNDKQTGNAKPEPAIREATLPDRPRAAVEIEDAPVTAQDVLSTIVAAGLKISRATLDPSQSIKLLSKGMSPEQRKDLAALLQDASYVASADSSSQAGRQSRTRSLGISPASLIFSRMALKTRLLRK